MKLVRVVLRAIPLLLTFLGLYFLYQYLFVDPFSSRFLTEPLALTTVIAPLLLLFEISAFEKRLRRPLLAMLSFTGTFSCVALMFGEVILVDLFGIPTVKYIFYPGGPLNAITAACSTAIVLGCYLAIQFGKKTSS